MIFKNKTKQIDPNEFFKIKWPLYFVVVNVVVVVFGYLDECDRNPIVSAESANSKCDEKKGKKTNFDTESIASAASTMTMCANMFVYISVPHSILSVSSYVFIFNFPNNVSLHQQTIIKL